MDLFKDPILSSVCDLLNLFCIPSPPLCEPYFQQYQYKQWQEEQNKQIRVSGKQFAHSSNVSSHPNTHSINETMQRGGWLVQRWCDMFCQETRSLLLTMHEAWYRGPTVTVLSHNFSWSRSPAALAFCWSKMLNVFSAYVLFFSLLALLVDSRCSGFFEKWLKA